MTSPRPTFFIVGAPRCGTTSLSKALARHPEICFSKPKETHFFIRDLPTLTSEFLDRNYVRRYFPHLGDAHRILGEGSVSYLYSPEALRRAREFDPGAKFVVMVRNPIDLIYSYHSKMLYTMDEEEADFARAWAMQEVRAKGQHLPRRCRDYRLLMYGDIGKLGQHVERLFDLVGREHVFVVVFDDLVQDPDGLLRNLCGFLGASEPHGLTIEKKNDNRQFKRGFLQRYLTNPPGIVLRAWAAGGSSVDEMMRRTRGLRKWIKRRNTYRATRPPMAADVRSMLADYFAADVRHLGALLGRDLSHWR